MHVDAEELQKLDLNTLKLQKDSFIDDKFKAYYSDVIYKVDSSEGEGYLYFLLEHQSTSDPFIVGKLLQYMANIINYDMVRQLSIDPDRSNLKLPVIYPFVVYSGKEKYKWPKQLTMDIKGCIPLDFSSCLIELQEYTLKELMKSGKAAAMQFVLRESWKKDFCKVLRDNPQLCELISNSPYATDTILYMISQDPHKQEVIKQIRNLNQKIKQDVMDNLREIEEKGIKLGEQRGIKLGEQRGKEQGFREAIFRLLANGMNKSKAAEVLGFTLKKLEKLLASAD